VERDPVLALMKFGSAEHMAELLRHGRIYMQPIPFFKALESDVARGDQNEGLSHCWQADGFRLDVRQEDEWVNVGGIVGQVLLRDGRAEVGNIYCMFALRGSHAATFFDGHCTQPVDVDRLPFGDSVVVFTNGDEFMRRVRAAAELEGLELSYDLVEYVDRETHSGPMGPFRKFSTFSQQSEFRILAKPERLPARILDVGSLEDIAMVCPRVELNQRLRLQQAVEPS
jgi:hypothetical protein